MEEADAMAVAVSRPVSVEAPDHSGWASCRLTPLEDDDIERLHEWQNAPGIRDMTMGFRFPVQKDAVRQWLKSQRERNGTISAVYAIRWIEELVGVVQLHAIEPYHRKARFGLFVGSTDHRNKGIGTIACLLMLDFAFKALDLRKVSLDVLATNEAAIRIYEAIGFQLEGVKKKDYFLDGQYLDVRFYSIFGGDLRIAIPPNACRLVHRVA
jgi:RimJ/RimL family protein N-acetyltransferase